MDGQKNKAQFLYWQILIGIDLIINSSIDFIILQPKYKQIFPLNFNWILIIDCNGNWHYISLYKYITNHHVGW